MVLSWGIKFQIDNIQRVMFHMSPFLYFVNWCSFGTPILQCYIQDHTVQPEILNAIARLIDHCYTLYSPINNQQTILLSAHQETHLSWYFNQPNHFPEKGIFSSIVHPVILSNSFIYSPNNPKYSRINPKNYFHFFKKI